MSRRSALLFAGAVAIAGSVVGVVLATVVADRRVTAAVEGMARAPVGCSTELDFTDAGTFWVYAESRGRLDDVSGGCQAPASWQFDETPQADVVLTVGQGVELELIDDTGRQYDVDGFAGQSIVRFDIVVPGPRTITVTSDSEGFAVAVGRDPDAAGRPWRFAALVVVALAMVVAAALVLVGLRRRPPPEGDIRSTLPLRDPSTMRPDVWAPPAWPPPVGSPPTSDGAWPPPG